ncbi:MAG: 30S ribosomal protein S4 [Endomicrobiia bacterium]
MARYIGPKSKIARKFGEPIFGPDKYLEKKNYPPGMHGLAKKRAKRSEYGTQLLEKQKAKFIYGVAEKQFANIFKKAHSKKGITGEVLLQLLEQRLDNVVYRLGFSKTRSGARQLVSHGHITVNGDIVKIPSYTVHIGEIIAVRERSRSLEVINEALSHTKVAKYVWMELDRDKMAGKLIAIPERNEIPENIKEQQIVELYSK